MKRPWNFLTGRLLDIAQRLLGRMFKRSVYVNAALVFSGYFLLGMGAGGSSLLLSPILVGSGIALIGLILRRQDKKTIRLESFACGSALALGMALIRFLYVK